jgi:hypothetical protein
LSDQIWLSLLSKVLWPLIWRSFSLFHPCVEENAFCSDILRKTFGLLIVTSQKFNISYDKSCSIEGASQVGDFEKPDLIQNNRWFRSDSRDFNAFWNLWSIWAFQWDWCLHFRHYHLSRWEKRIVVRPRVRQIIEWFVSNDVHVLPDANVGKVTTL